MSTRGHTANRLRGCLSSPQAYRGDWFIPTPTPVVLLTSCAWRKSPSELDCAEVRGCDSGARGRGERAGCVCEGQKVTRKYSPRTRQRAAACSRSVSLYPSLSLSPLLSSPSFLPSLLFALLPFRSSLRFKKATTFLR